MILVLSLLICASRVHVEEGAYTEQLARALAEEPNLVVGTASTAEMYVRLMPAEQGLMLTVREPAGAVALERRIDLARGLDPALRMAVLLVRGALEPLPEPPKVAKVEKTEPPPIIIATVEPVPTATETWSMKASAAVMSDLVHAELGGAIALHGHVWRFAVGGAFMYGAWFAGENTVSVETEVTQLVVVGDVAFVLIEDESFAISLFGSFGVQHRLVNARGAFEGNGTSYTTPQTSPVGLAGGELRLALAEALALEVRLGLKISSELEVGLPAAFVPPVAEEPLRANVFAGFASAGLSLEIF